MLMDFPSPTRKQAHFSINFFALSIARHVGELDLLGSALSQSSLTLYIDRNTSIQRLCLPDATIQANLARSASLTPLVFFFETKTTYTSWLT